MKILKISFLTSLLLFVFIFPTSANAQLSVTGTIIGGKVTQNGAPVPGAAVTVNCEGSVRSATTNGGGDYAVTYSKSDCANTDSVTVTASKDGNIGSKDGTVYNWSADIDLAIVNVVISVPEFGLIPGALAALTSTGIFLNLRRRKM